MAGGAKIVAVVVQPLKVVTKRNAILIKQTNVLTDLSRLLG
jgi:hypothetical protein